ncbi:hypothetical protein LG296_19715 (plasmid) [Ureibacillus chungkukjangi]|uniref:hypothetical protein n=1 Tax=Ureibacillus chungkukjangi TaxID=1202712 RepID=UPI000D3A174F|nr:hypothetical protein [Ureibacillus chungkukjangi]MCM3390541.1 hypothetical protein [Ureibacillus chungkukjangi]
MKWIIEINDTPENKDYPITGYQECSNGVKRGPYLFTVADILKGLVPMTQHAPIHSEQTADYFKDEKRIPTLPFGTVGYSSDAFGKERVTMVIDKEFWSIRYRNNEKSYLIGFPKLVIQYILVPVGNTKHRRVVKTRLFAVKDDHKRITDETILYSFPFPNVKKTSGGEVCWGMNSDLTIQSLTELDQILHLFLNAPFNEDYGCRLANGVMHFGKYLETAQDVPFDDENLLPIPYGAKDFTFGLLYGQEYVNEQCL